MPVFLFTDIEGSTRLWEEHTGQMGAVIAQHDAILQELVSATDGRITKHTGDGITAVFESGQPLVCALQAQREFAVHAWGEIGELRVRVGIHAGQAEYRPSTGTVDGDYFGPSVNATARIMSAAWGGQILLTPEVVSVSPLPPHATLLDLGQHLLKDVSAPQQIYQLVHPDLPRVEFPPPRSLSGRAISRTVDQEGQQLAGLEPEVMAVSLVSATLLPTLWGERPPGSRALAGNLGVLRDLGAGTLASLLAQFAEQLPQAEPAEIRQQLEVALLARWRTDVRLRADASRLLHAVQGVDAAMAAATSGLREALAQGLADLGSQFIEFHWMLGGLQDAVAEVRSRQELQLALQHEQLAMMEEVLQLERARPVDHLAGGDAPSRSPLVPPPLPTTVTPLIGREAEQDLLARLLDQSWLITIVGPGGMGKTRLALAAAATWQRTGQVAAFASLAELNEPEGLSAAIACALGIQLTPDSDPTSQLLAFLRQKTLLLVLDNFEHLLQGTPLLTQMRQAAPGLTLLVTSRQRLHLPGEQLLPLQGLGYPLDFNELSDMVEARDLAQYPAVQLFLDHAHRLLPDFTSDDTAALLRLCQITEGMPLALELAAAWVDTLPLSELLMEVTHNLGILTQEQPHRPMRHHSIRAVFETTWQLLSPAEQQAFARLAVFCGGFTRAAAEAVAKIDLPMLSALVGWYLVQLDRGSGRYTLHELMRQYGMEQLASRSDLVITRQRHFAFYLDLAETADAHLRGPEQSRWLERLDAEQDNCRATLRWAFSHSTLDAANLILAMHWYWRIRNRVVEARQWLAKVLAEELGDTAVSATLHFQAGHMAWMQGDFTVARQCQENSLVLWQSPGTAGINGRAYAYHALGMIDNQEGELVEAREQFTHSLRLFEQSQDRWGVAFAQLWLGYTLRGLGDMDHARTMLETSLAAVRRIGDRWAAGLIVNQLSWLEWDCGNWEQAFTFAEEASRIAETMGHWHSLGGSLHLLAQIAHKRGDLAAARRLYRKSLTLYADMGNERAAAELEAALRLLDARK